MRRVELEINGKLHQVWALTSKNGIWFHWNGETWFFERTKSGKSRQKEETAGGDILAPMPGKITKVLVTEGQAVELKQTLVVMEAMKMEYNLRASAVGKVKKVYCREGDQVPQDQLLVEFEK